ncbi:MAG: TIR domain-containing protein [Planctomycetota bacterium]|nr:TIR domain-containing protein [Planctomycetota bacterium]
MIFVSYRNPALNPQVARLVERLAEEFGSEAVFRDRDCLPGSQNFPETLEVAVRECSVFLAAICPQWKKALFEEGHVHEFTHRLSDPNDWVRREISLALREGKVIVPVRIEAVKPPTEAWLRPFGLERLATIHGPELRTNDFETDFSAVADLLCGLCPDLRVAREKQRAKQPQPTPPGTIPTGPLLPSVAAYLQRLTTDTSRLRLLGLGRHPRISLPISEAYVPLQAVYHPSFHQQEFGKFPVDTSDRELQLELSQVFLHARKAHLRGVVLLGEPGAGKTTGARQLAWSLASGAIPPATMGLPEDITPVFLKFRNFRTALRKHPAGLSEFLCDETHCPNVADPLKNPGRDLWNLPTSKILWILDGLDEVVEPGARQTVAGWLRQAIIDRVDDRFLVTSRYQGYHASGVPLQGDFVEYHVRPLTPAQVEKFVLDWFRSVYSQMLTHEVNSAATGAAEGERLLRVLSLSAYQTGRVLELTSNPLLLTILCMVFDEQHDLPTGRAELYENCVRVMLQHWRKDLYSEERDLKLVPYDAEGAQTVLARVAWWLPAEAARGLAMVADSAGLGRDGRAFLQKMLDETGILAMGGAGDGRCGFLHRSFQEFLAADHAAREGLAQELAVRADDAWWREVALLSLRRSRPYCEAFFGEMLRSVSPRAIPISPTDV